MILLPHLPTFSCSACDGLRKSVYGAAAQTLTGTPMHIPARSPTRNIRRCREEQGEGVETRLRHTGHWKIRDVKKRRARKYYRMQRSHGAATLHVLCHIQAFAIAFWARFVAIATARLLERSPMSLWRTDIDSERDRQEGESHVFELRRRKPWLKELSHIRPSSSDVARDLHIVDATW